MNNRMLIKDLEFKVRVCEEKERIFDKFNSNKELIKNCRSFQYLSDICEFIQNKWQVVSYDIRANYLIVIEKLINQSLAEINLTKQSHI